MSSEMCLAGLWPGLEVDDSRLSAGSIPRLKVRNVANEARK